MQGVKEECFAAGMNDYVSKPIDPIQLSATIEKWLKPERKMISHEGSVEEIPPKNPEKGMNFKEQESTVLLPEGIPGIDIATGLHRLDGNRRLYRKLLEDFTKNYARSADEIRMLLEQKDTQTALRLAHTLKGVGGNISLDDIRNTAAELETVISTGQEDRCDSLTDQLGREIRYIVQTMENLAPGKVKDSEKKVETGSESALVDFSAVEPVLKELARLVWEDNVDARDLAEKLRVLLGYSDFAKDAGTLSASIEDYDFETAKDSLRQMALALGITIEGGEGSG
jgi:HPt (histidine-containing phosphotransfer) domain-containing protein